jgi:hypothetical protein
MAEFAVERMTDPGSPGKTTVSVRGPMTVPYAGDLAAQLRDAFDKSNELLMDVRGVSEIDLAGLQLVFAAHLSAVGSGKTFGVIDGDAGILVAAAESAGFSRHPAWRELMGQSRIPCERSE